ncbi:MAG: hypothetical protein M1840_005556 [Geoglossum simile]|nr:MAG: hypothetical protein M1840_005556 [Geoglossum simile]
MSSTRTQHAHTQLAPQLDCRASLWNLLSSRQDIDSVTLELLGRHFVDRTRLGSPEGSAFNLACQLEVIFGLQRAHLQSHPPWDQQSDLALRTIAERFPYILSLRTAKDAFACLSKQAMDYLEVCSGKQDDETSLRRMVIVRTIVSGTRMLCLHPDAISHHASLSSLSLRIGPNFGLWERILCQTCNFALRQEPRRRPPLKLHKVGLNGNMVWILVHIIVSDDLSRGDSRLLLHISNKYIDNFFSDPHSKFWDLYDISWSIVAAFLQCQAVRAEGSALEFFILATEIANGVMVEARKEPEDAETCALLLDIVELFHPVLVAGGGQREGTWQTPYDRILGEIFPGRASLFNVYHACVSEEVITLRGFEYDLKQRQVLAPSDSGEASVLLSQLEEVCLSTLNTYNGCKSGTTYNTRTNRPREKSKLYILNCGAKHIIAEDHDCLSRLLNDEPHRLLRENESLVISGGDQCPLCISNADPHPTFTRFREASPLNAMLEAIAQKRQELKANEVQRLRVNSPIKEGITTISTEERATTHERDSLFPSSHSSPHNSPPLESGLIPVNQTQSSSSSLGSSVGFGQAPHPSQGLQVVNPWSPLKKTGGSRIFSAVKRFGSPRKNSITESYSELPSGEPDALGHAISLEPLGQGKKSVALSADFKRIVFWTKKNLAVLSRPNMDMVLIPLEGSDLIIASRSYCAIARRYIDHDEVRWYKFDQGFDWPVHSVSFEQNSSPDVVQCLAIAPDDTHLAVGLKGGSVKLYSLPEPSKSQTLNFGIPDSNNPTVASLSFTADEGELVASIRSGGTVYVYYCQRPFTNPMFSFTLDIGSHERDNQGVSSVVRRSNQDLFCITSWTLHGTPLLRDGATGKTKPLDKAELTGAVDMSNRVQQATFSKSGQILALVDATGGIFKISPESIERVRTERIASSLRLRWKAKSIQNQQLLDMKIADDEKHICVVWIDEKKNYAQVMTLPTGIGD